MVNVAISNETKRLQKLVRHIEDVNNDCQVLGIRLIERGEEDLGRTLIANGFVHDHSKFTGIEWEHLDSRADPLFESAWAHHVTTNPHHPEYWNVDGAGGIHQMGRVYVAEMVADWHSRGSEFDGCSLRGWIGDEATRRFDFCWADEVGRQITDFLELLLEHWN